MAGSRRLGSRAAGGAARGDDPRGASAQLGLLPKSAGAARAGAGDRREYRSGADRGWAGWRFQSTADRAIFDTGDGEWRGGGDRAEQSGSVRGTGSAAGGNDPDRSQGAGGSDLRAFGLRDGERSGTARGGPDGDAAGLVGRREV